MTRSLQITELEALCFEFGEAMLEAVAEKESTGEIASKDASSISLQLSQWQRQGQELLTIARERRLL
jgi:hypothetical protein